MNGIPQGKKRKAAAISKGRFEVRIEGLKRQGRLFTGHEAAGKDLSRPLFRVLKQGRIALKV